MKKLNLGCGPHTMKDWFNYDIDGINRNDVVPIDLSKGKLPHFDGTVDFIFSEHFIEHISRSEALKLLKECHRTLKPKGVVRITTPDLKKLLSDYFAWLEINNDYFKPDIPQVWNPSSPCDMVNEGMRLWGHQYLYDAGALIGLAVEAGFHVAQACLWHESRCPELRNLEVRPYHGELIFEFTKTGLTGL